MRQNPIFIISSKFSNSRFQNLIRQMNESVFIRGSFWTLFGYGGSQIFRLAGNLILTRLLFAEAFGLMALVNVFLMAADMFSDLGIGPSIIQNPKGNQPAFLKTAWTIQAIRGGTLWLILTLLAYPLSIFYHQPALFYIIPIVAINSLLAGFNSTAIFTLNRDIRLKEVIIVDLSTQVLGLTLMIIIAWIHPTVWALAIGGVITTATKMICGHIFLPAKTKHRLYLDSESVHSFFHFGRWIFLSTILGFFAIQGDRLILGKMLSLSELGMYSIAIFMASAIPNALDSLADKVIFPLYTKLSKEPHESMRKSITAIRMKIMGISLIPVCLIIGFGDKIIHFLYDERYHEAGWMLQILSIGTIGTILSQLISPITMARGNSFIFMSSVAIVSVLFITCMAIGGFLGGAKGLIIGIAVSRFLLYPFIAIYAKKYGIWTPWLDIAYLLIGGGLAYGTWAIVH